MPVMNIFTQYCLVAITLFGASMAAAQTVYKTVDESGAVSFSDKPPEADIETETLELHAPPPSSDSTQQDNLEAMRETTDRMAQDRREREKHRAEMRELQAKTNAAAESDRTQDYYDDYYPVYTGYNNRRYYNHRPPYRPGWKPKPEHPIARPPIRPKPHNTGSNNSQLMRPIVSSKR